MHTVAGRQGFARKRRRANAQNVAWTQLGGRIRRAVHVPAGPIPSALPNSVAAIFAGRHGNQVGWVAARRIVAGMADQLAGWKMTVREEVSRARGNARPVGEHLRKLVRAIAVTRHSSAPRPAGLRARARIDVRPEAVECPLHKADGPALRRAEGPVRERLRTVGCSAVLTPTRRAKRAPMGVMATGGAEDLLAAENAPAIGIKPDRAKRAGSLDRHCNLPSCRSRRKNARQPVREAGVRAAGPSRAMGA